MRLPSIPTCQHSTPLDNVPAYKRFAWARGLGFGKPSPLSLPRRANLAIPISFCSLHKKVFASIDITSCRCPVPVTYDTMLMAVTSLSEWPLGKGGVWLAWTEGKRGSLARRGWGDGVGGRRAGLELFSIRRAEMAVPGLVWKAWVQAWTERSIFSWV